MVLLVEHQISEPPLVEIQIVVKCLLVVLLGGLLVVKDPSAVKKQVA